jgi:uncharacterized protein YbjT (DUF2867 family)
MPTVFLAGATGAVGQAFLPRAEAAGIEVRPHVRPASAGKLDHPRRVLLELADPTLVEHLRGCDVVVSLVGTMRKRFHTGDTYETSDIDSARQLVAAAKVAGVPRFVVLSSVGAGRPMGPYLAAKARAEGIVADSGLRYTILRPSAFEDRDGSGMPVTRALTRWLGMRRYEPIRLDELASALVNVVLRDGPDGVLEGEGLWAVV